MDDSQTPSHRQQLGIDDEVLRSAAEVALTDGTAIVAYKEETRTDS